MDVDLSQACALLCPTVNSDIDGDDGHLTAFSWVGVVLLFIISELLSYVDVEPNGVLQAGLHAATSLLRRGKFQ